MSLELDVAANRRARKYSAGEILRRILWSFGALLFLASPRPCFEWRCMVLRLFGAKIGKHVHIYPSARIYFPWNLTVGDWSAIGEEAFIYNIGSVTIGKQVTISQRAHLCAGTHDYRKATMPLLKVSITVGDQAWICADAFIGPDMVVGTGAIVGARAVVVNHIDPWTIVAGNPAHFIKMREMEAD